MNNVVDHPCLRRDHPGRTYRVPKEIAASLRESVADLEHALSCFRLVQAPLDRQARHVDIISRLHRLIADGRELQRRDMLSLADVAPHLDRLNELIADVRRYCDCIRRN